ncbi:MAG: elongation factor G [Clostridiales bacterium]|nr:elongation factor G [Clostridiales bacterium]
MPEITTKNIRNVCLLGHGSSGKTSLAEAMLFCAGAIDRMGKVTDGNTVTDYDPEEVARHYSVSLSTANFTYHDIKVNLLDTPGYPDFVGEELEGIRAADAAVIMVDGKAGLEVGTELAWEYACRANIPKVFFINKFDDPEADFSRVFEQLREAFGIRVCPVLVPVRKGGEMVFVSLVDRIAYVYDERGKRTEMPMDDELSAIVDQYSQQFNEAIAETSDALMEKFFAEEEITKEEAAEALHEGIISGSIVPVYSGSVTKLWGVRALMTSIKDSFPRVTAKKTERVIEGDEVKPYTIDPEGDCSLFIFKTVADQFGKMSLFKVMSGTLKKDASLTNARTGAMEKAAHIYTLRGKKQTEVDSLCCGDIGVLSKLTGTATNDTLYGKVKVQYEGTKFPEPYMTKALSAEAKGDEDKISTGIARLLEEDPTLRYVNNAETKQLTLSGISDIHLDVVRSRLKNRYGTKVVYTDPRIPYRETIKKSVQAEGKHKKQSGGSGQYGHVKITFSPGAEEGLTFTQSVVGGTVPKGFYPAVEKGLLEAMQKGVLAGYPVVNLAADLYDGSYHAVDSNEISFKLAAKLAYKNGLPQANPVLLEPVGEMKISVPDSMVGDVMGDLNKRRGRVMGMSPDEERKGYTVVEAEAPQAELQDYTIVLRAMTQGRGAFTYRFVRYEEVPATEAQKIIAEAKAQAEEE